MSHKSKIVIISVIFLAILIGLGIRSVWATTYYLDPAVGDNGNDGKSWANAWDTMEYTTSVIDANSDTLYMRNTNFEVTHFDWPTLTTIYAIDINMYGEICWTFDVNYVVGQFASRDVWVQAGGDGDVNIVNIRPLSTDANGFVQHGSMINPVAFTQGYSEGMITTTYYHNLNAAFDINGVNNLTIEPNDSLISTRSKETQNQTSQLISCAILTCVATPPAAGTFRPAYFGTSKDYSYNVSDINYAHFQSLAPTANPMTLHKDSYTDSTDYDETAERIVERPHLAHRGGQPVRYLMPDNCMNGYGREYDGAISAAALMLHLNYTNSQKKRLIVGFLQQGLDQYPLMVDSPTAFRGDGSACPDFRFAIFITGLALNIQGMKDMMGKSGDYLYNANDWPPTIPGDYVNFPFEDQVYYVMTDTVYSVPYSYVDQGSGNYGYGHGRYFNGTLWDYPEFVTGHIGMPNWTEKIAWYGIISGVANWQSIGTGSTNSEYRIDAAKCYIGIELAAMMTGETALWNSNRGIDYCDRHFANTDTGGLWASSPISTSQRHYYLIQTEMYNEYRDDVASERAIWVSSYDEWPPDAPTSLVTAPATNSRVSLSWTASAAAADGDGATSYRVYRGTGASRVLVGNPTGTSFVDTTPLPETSYDYMISAVDDFGIESEDYLEGSETSGGYVYVIFRAN
jgi:hypothetical protein